MAKYAAAVERALQGLQVRLLLEPGRFLIAQAGALLARVLVVKRNGSKTFVITDAGMNDLIRPALYQAHHEILPVVQNPKAKPAVVDIVGPVCETGDFFARDREMPEVKEGDLVAILDTGAYGMSLSSNYNSRPRPAEVLVEGQASPADPPPGNYPRPDPAGEAGWSDCYTAGISVRIESRPVEVRPTRLRAKWQCFRD